MLIASITPVTSLTAAGRVPRPVDVARPDSSAASATASARTSSLTDPVRPLLDPATQLAAQGSRRDKGGSNPLNLTDEEKAQVRELRQTDAEVHRHEQAHASVGGPYAGLPSYKYVRGPDGQSYAVGGEVSIDASPAKDPEATIRKMETVIKAALAPADPSPQDHAIANKARQIKAQAVAEKRAEQIDAAGTSGNGDDSQAGVGAVADRAASLYQRIAGLVAEPLGLVTPPAPVEVVV